MSNKYVCFSQVSLHTSNQSGERKKGGGGSGERGVSCFCVRIWCTSGQNYMVSMVMYIWYFKTKFNDLDQHLGECDPGFSLLFSLITSFVLSILLVYYRCCSCCCCCCCCSYSCRSHCCGFYQRNVNHQTSAEPDVSRAFVHSTSQHWETSTLVSREVTRDNLSWANSIWRQWLEICDCAAGSPVCGSRFRWTRMRMNCLC